MNGGYELPRKRDLTSLAQHHDLVQGFTPRRGWLQFQQTASRQALVAVLRALVAALPDERRQQVEHAIGVAEPGLREYVSGAVRPPFVRFEDCVRKIAARGGAAYADRGAEAFRLQSGIHVGCDAGVLYRHLALIQQALSDYPKAA